MPASTNNFISLVRSFYYLILLFEFTINELNGEKGSLKKGSLKKLFRTFSKAVLALPFL